MAGKWPLGPEDLSFEVPSVAARKRFYDAQKNGGIIAFARVRDPLPPKTITSLGGQAPTVGSTSTEATHDESFEQRDSIGLNQPRQKGGKEISLSSLEWSSLKSHVTDREIESQVKRDFNSSGMRHRTVMTDNENRHQPREPPTPERLRTQRQNERVHKINKNGWFCGLGSLFGGNKNGSSRSDHINGKGAEIPSSQFIERESNENIGKTNRSKVGNDHHATGNTLEICKFGKFSGLTEESEFNLYDLVPNSSADLSTSQGFQIAVKSSEISSVSKRFQGVSKSGEISNASQRIQSVMKPGDVPGVPNRFQNVAKSGEMPSISEGLQMKSHQILVKRNYGERIEAVDADKSLVIKEVLDGSARLSMSSRRFRNTVKSGEILVERNCADDNIGHGRGDRPDSQEQGRCRRSDLNISRRLQNPLKSGELLVDGKSDHREQIGLVGQDLSDSTEPVRNVSNHLSMSKRFVNTLKSGDLLFRRNSEGTSGPHEIHGLSFEDTIPDGPSDQVESKSKRFLNPLKSVELLFRSSSFQRGSKSISFDTKDGDGIGTALLGSSNSLSTSENPKHQIDLLGEHESSTPQRTPFWISRFMKSQSRIWMVPKSKLHNSSRCLRIDPDKRMLFIYNPSKKNLACSVRLENLSLITMAFKFKCTSPEGYFMQPTIGVIPPNTVMIATVLKLKSPMAKSVESKKREKFVIASLPYRGDISSPIDARIFDRYQNQVFIEKVLYPAYNEYDRIFTARVSTDSDSAL